jgi:hypothetical protein
VDLAGGVEDPSGPVDPQGPMDLAGRLRPAAGGLAGLRPAGSKTSHSTREHLMQTLHNAQLSM